MSDEENTDCPTFREEFHLSTDDFDIDDRETEQALEELFDQVRILRERMFTDTHVKRPSEIPITEMVRFLQTFNQNGAPETWVVDMALALGRTNEEVESEIQALKRSGEIYEPGRDFLRAVR
jgi:hypothetical protein